MRCGNSGQEVVEAGPTGEYDDECDWLECWDEVSGKPLDPQKVKQARAEEIRFSNTGKGPIRVKWVEINKGDDDHLNYRS